jgi:hypothetical protein
MKIDNRDIFEQIGNLLYAIAADQHVKPLQVGELKSLISKDWLPRNFSESNVSDETHCIVMTIDSLTGSNATAKEAFDEFAKFYALHQEVFSDEVKQRMLDTSVEITKFFKADNPFSNQHLVALRDLLKLGKVEA